MPNSVKRSTFKSRKSPIKIWLMVLPFILLLVGLAAAALLLSGNQDLRQQASGFNVPYVCTPNQIKCSSDLSSLEKCIDGQWQRTSCGLDTACLEKDGTASCVRYVCSTDLIPDTLVCDGQSYYGCKDGRYQKQGTCPDGTVCEVMNGPYIAVCRPTCQHNAARCTPDGSSIEVCNTLPIPTYDVGWVKHPCKTGTSCSTKNGVTDCYLKAGSRGSVKK